MKLRSTDSSNTVKSRGTIALLIIMALIIILMWICNLYGQGLTKLYYILLPVFFSTDKLNVSQNVQN